MHRIETTHKLIFEKRSRPLEGNYARTSWGAEQVYLATEYLRSRNWKELDKIGKVYLKREYGLWYVGKFKKGELYETIALPVIDEDHSLGDWLAIIIAARRTGLPFRVYAKQGAWDYWKRFDVRFRGLEPGTVRGHQANVSADAGKGVPSAKAQMQLGRPSDSGSPSTPKERQETTDSWQMRTSGSVEAWATSRSARTTNAL